MIINENTVDQGFAEGSCMNEALKPSKIGWYGNSNPKLPDGTPELSGENKAISVTIAEGDANKYAVLGLMGDEGEDLLQKEFTDKDSAIKFGEKLLKEVKDPMYDPKKVAKKYGMMYFAQ